MEASESAFEAASTLGVRMGTSSPELALTAPSEEALAWASEAAFAPGFRRVTSLLESVLIAPSEGASAWAWRAATPAREARKEKPCLESARSASSAEVRALAEW